MCYVLSFNRLQNTSSDTNKLGEAKTSIIQCETGNKHLFQSPATTHRVTKHPLGPPTCRNCVTDLELHASHCNSS